MGRKEGRRERYGELPWDATGYCLSATALLSTRSVPSKTHLRRRLEQVKGGFAFNEVLSLWIMCPGWKTSPEASVVVF